MTRNTSFTCRIANTKTSDLSLTAVSSHNHHHSPKRTHHHITSHHHQSHQDEMLMRHRVFVIPVLLLMAETNGLSMVTNHQNSGVSKGSTLSRRTALGWMVAMATTTTTTTISSARAAEKDTRPDRLDEEEYLRRGFVQNPMGVSGQAGKSRPETGVLLRDGSEVFRDSRTGQVSAEIVLESSDSSNQLMPVLTSYESPWPLATGSLFDVECRDPKTGDGAFVAVTPSTKGKGLAELKDSFFTNNLFSPQGRFSFYGQPTDIKITSSKLVPSNGISYRQMDVSFATLSQSTMTEIPRKARIVATIPAGSAQAVLLVASASSLRWNKVEGSVRSTVESFRAIPAPKSSLKVRVKRNSS